MVLYLGERERACACACKKKMLVSSERVRARLSDSERKTHTDTQTHTERHTHTHRRGACTHTQHTHTQYTHTSQCKAAFPGRRGFGWQRHYLRRRHCMYPPPRLTHTHLTVQRHHLCRRHCMYPPPRLTHTHFTVQRHHLCRRHCTYITLEHIRHTLGTHPKGSTDVTLDGNGTILVADKYKKNRVWSVPPGWMDTYVHTYTRVCIHTYTRVCPAVCSPHPCRLLPASILCIRYARKVETFLFLFLKMSFLFAYAIPWKFITLHCIRTREKEKEK
jgi:hypothetical protein